MCIAREVRYAIGMAQFRYTATLNFDVGRPIRHAAQFPNRPELEGVWQRCDARILCERGM